MRTGGWIRVRRAFGHTRRISTPRSNPQFSFLISPVRRDPFAARLRLSPLFCVTELVLQDLVAAEALQLQVELGRRGERG